MLVLERGQHFFVGMWTNQQHPDGHESSGSSGHGAVHQDDVVLADVFGQTEVVELQDGDKAARHSRTKSQKQKKETVKSTVD